MTEDVAAWNLLCGEIGTRLLLGQAPVLRLWIAGLTSDCAEQSSAVGASLWIRGHRIAELCSAQSEGDDPLGKVRERWIRRAFLLAHTLFILKRGVVTRPYRDPWERGLLPGPNFSLKNSLDSHVAIGYNAGLMDGAGSAGRLTG